MKTVSPSPRPMDTRNWYVVDASGQTLGRLASGVARILRGKHRREFSPHADQGDFVVVVNAEKIRVTGKKLTDKIYYRHSGYPGGLRQESLKELLARKPERAVELAVRGMLPGNSLGDDMYRKLKVYAGPEHPHAAQKPVDIDQAPGQAAWSKGTATQ
ncbi:MAG TPA: 50S ribosomal protein L13 [Chloroflexota bacterium]|jgi:large subunit ribosomal protein L13|nr:50S ribosomal protein L13 [Chloroflexota bacterium]